MANTWGDQAWRRVVVWIVGLSALILAALSVRLSLYCDKSVYAWVYGFWIITPPGWFFVEYHFIFNRKDDNNAREQLKIGQDVAQRFWAALLVLLGAIGYFRWTCTLH